MAERSANRGDLLQLEKRRLVRAEWKTSDNNQRAKYSRLTPAGRRHLMREHSRWTQLVEAVHALMGARRQEGEPCPRARGSNADGTRRSRKRSNRICRWRSAIAS